MAPDQQGQEQQLNQVDLIKAAAQLLVEIAGPAPVHIEMSARGPKKYYDVHRPLEAKDACAHLQSWKTKGVCWLLVTSIQKIGIRAKNITKEQPARTGSRSHLPKRESF